MLLVPRPECPRDRAVLRACPLVSGTRAPRPSRALLRDTRLACSSPRGSPSTSLTPRGKTPDGYPIRCPPAVRRRAGPRACRGGRNEQPQLVVREKGGRLRRRERDRLYRRAVAGGPRCERYGRREDPARGARRAVRGWETGGLARGTWPRGSRTPPRKPGPTPGVQDTASHRSAAV